MTFNFFYIYIVQTHYFSYWKVKHLYTYHTTNMVKYKKTNGRKGIVSSNKTVQKKMAYQCFKD